MNHPLSYRPFIAFVLLSATCLQAQTTSTTLVPTSLPGLDVFARALEETVANPATAPLPRLDWFIRVKNNNDKAAKVAGNIQLVFDGDSITDWWQGAGRQLWQDRYAKLGAFDFGIAGDRTQHLLWRLSQGQMKGIQPKLILVMIGTNNDDPIEQVAEGIKAIIEQYRSLCPDAVILLQGIFPRSPNPTDPYRERIKGINKIIATFADGKNVRYTDFGDKFLQPIFDRIGFMHGRIASPGHMQVPIDATESRPAAAVGLVDYYADFRTIWARAMRGFREKAGPGDVLIFTPELLSGTHYYARLFPCPDGKMTEESDRYTQALLYADIARRLFKEAFASG